jgi:AraC-like DNA-binding protein
MSGISWGVYSITLLIGSVQGLFLACLLLSAKLNRSANRALAFFLLGVVLLITPYTLGFAGFFDSFRWLNFAPFYWELGFGPLIWLYVRQIGFRSMPRRWLLHFLPVALQGGYYSCVWIALPTAYKENYNDQFHIKWVVPVLALARCISYLGYAVATVLAFRAYQRWLAEHSGQREEYRLQWLSRLLWSIGFVLLLDASVVVIELFVYPLAYSQQFPLYVLFAILVWVLGLEGWRHAASPYPRMDDAAPSVTNDPAAVESAAPVTEVPRRVHDWAALATQWIAAIEHHGWYRQSDLSLATVARRLGTNAAYLSRALNEGAALSFSDCVNTLRVNAAKDRLGGQANILDVAFDVGFASKASFNRVFKASTGQTPSAFRNEARRASPKS